MADKRNNKKENINNVNNQEEKNMKKKATKITVSMANGQIMITKIDGKAVDEPRRFGVYNVKEGMLPHISIRPKVGGWLEMDVRVVEDENGKMSVEAVREPDAYWAMAEFLMGSKKAVNKAKKNLIEARKNAISAKEARQAEQTANTGTLVGATKHGFIFSKPMAGMQEEIIDLGKFGQRTLRYGKGLECSKVYDGDKEVAYIFWKESGKSPRIRLLSEEQKRYYMKAYNQDAFIYYDGDKKVTVMDGKLANALWFFYKNFVLKLAELKNWELPIAHKGMPQEYWDALEKDIEAEEAARTKKDSGKKADNNKQQ